MLTSRPFCIRQREPCTAQTSTLLPLLQLRYSCSEAHPELCRRYSENENVFDSFWRCNTSAKRGGKLWWQKLSVSLEHMFCLQRCAVRRQRGSSSVTSLWEPTMALTGPGKEKKTTVTTFDWSVDELGAEMIIQQLQSCCRSSLLEKKKQLSGNLDWWKSLLSKCVKSKCVVSYFACWD